MQCEYVWPKAFCAVGPGSICDIEWPDKVFIHQVASSRSILNKAILWPETSDDLNANLTCVAKFVDARDFEELVASFDGAGLLKPYPPYYDGEQYEAIADPQRESELPFCCWRRYRWDCYEELIGSISLCDPNLVFTRRKYDGLRSRRFLGNREMKQLGRVLPHGIVLDVCFSDAVLAKAILSMVLQVAAFLHDETASGDGLIAAGWRKRDGGYEWVDIPCAEHISGFIEFARGNGDEEWRHSVRLVDNGRGGSCSGIFVAGSWQCAARAFLSAMNEVFDGYRMRRKDVAGAYPGNRSIVNEHVYLNRFALWHDLIMRIVEGPSAGWKVKRCSCGRFFLSRDVTRTRHKCRACCSGNSYMPPDCSLNLIDAIR